MAIRHEHAKDSVSWQARRDLRSKHGCLLSSSLTILMLSSGQESAPRGRPLTEPVKQALRELGLEHALQLKEAEQQALLKAARKRVGEGRPKGSGSTKSRLRERPVALQLKLAKSMEYRVFGFADLDEFFTAQSKRLGMTRGEAKNLWQRKEVLKTVQRKHRLALNPAAHRGAKGLHSKTHLQKRYRGIEPLSKVRGEGPCARGSRQDGSGTDEPPESPASASPL